MRGSGASKVVVLAAIACGLLAGCSREQQDWKSAQAADTVEAYGDFIAKHGDSDLAAQARARSAQLVEERDWQRISTADTLEGYQQFVAQHPNGKWTSEARIRIENFTLAGDAPAAAPSDGAATPPGEDATAAVSPDSPPGVRDAVQPGEQATAAKPVVPKPASKPASKPAAASGKFAVQLGAFSSEAKANESWQAARTKFPRELGALQSHVAKSKTSAGQLYRLQASVADEARARSLCATLKTRGQACVVVLP